MMKWEARLVESIRTHMLTWACVCAAVLGLVIRYSFIPLVVADNEFFFTPWYAIAREQGLAALAVESNYSPLYLYLFTLMAKCCPTADGVKYFAIALEAGLIAAACLLTWRSARPLIKRRDTALCFILLCMNPVLILGAAGWGQVDMGYAALAVLSIWLLLKGNSRWAMVSLGLALSLKLQAVFLIPLFLIYNFVERKFSFLELIIVPAVWILLGVPMALCGQSPLYAVTCYLAQTELYSNPTFNCPNVFALLGDAMSGKQMIQGMWSRYGMALCVAALGGMLTWLTVRRRRLDERATLLLGAWCVLCCIFFLPRMHERYGIIGEVLLLCWAVCAGKPKAFAYVLLGLLPTLSAYCEYMFKKPMFSLQLGGAMNMLLLALLTWELVRTVPAQEAAGA